MPKSFEERCQAAIKPSSRAPDVKRVLADLDRLATELNDKAAALRQRSLDPDTSGDEARSAKADAESATFEIERLRALRPRLEARLQQIEDRDRERAEDENRQRLLDETSALAAKLTDRWPALTCELVALLAETEANANAVDAYNRGQAQHARILCAEFQARGVAGASWPNMGGWVERLFSMRIPGFMSPRDEWPIDHHRADMAKADAAAHAQLIAAKAREMPQARAEAKRREEARWSQYDVRQARYCGTRVAIDHRQGKAGIGHEPSTILSMDERQVAAAEAKGMVVKAVPVEAEAGADG
jgi:hypothetical protein